MKGKSKCVLNYEIDAWECGLFKLKKEGYYVVILKSHEAMQCFYLWVDAGSVPSSSIMFMILRVIFKA